MERTNRMNDDIFSGTDKGPIEFVRKGMQVIDATGQDIGKVEFVKMGDAEATTVGADQTRDGGFIQDVAEVFGFDSDPDVPPAFRARLLRTGFLKIDGGGLTDSDLYVAADDIASVSSDTVRLARSRDQLIDEA